MKHSFFHLLMFAVALAAAGSCGATFAALVDFDDLALAADTAKFGPFADVIGSMDDPFGGELPVTISRFASGGVKFTNRFANSWGTADGFAYSNQTDTTTPGPDNQYSAITGTGRGPGDDNYGVAFGYKDNLDPNDPAQLAELPHFELPAVSNLQSAYFTNTTYTALTIRDGDDFGYSHKFGGEDGTNPDWFKLTVYATNGAGMLLPNTVEVYLADYRFDDPEEDGYLETWLWVDLSPLAGAKFVYFNTTSSDVGAGGMLTPGYFAIDDLEFVTVPEPSSWVLLGLGAAILGYVGRRRQLTGGAARRFNRGDELLA